MFILLRHDYSTINESLSYDSQKVFYASLRSFKYYFIFPGYLGVIYFFYVGFLSLDIQESQDSRGTGSPIVILFYHNPLYEH